MIVVDPNAVNPAAPTRAVSPDGFLTATLDSGHAGVLLEADFGARPERVVATNLCPNPKFATDTTGWIGTGLTRVTTTYGTAGQCSLASGYLASPSASGVPAGSMVSIRVKVWAGNAGAVGATVNLRGHDGTGYFTDGQDVILTEEPQDVAVPASVATVGTAPRIFFYPRTGFDNTTDLLLATDAMIVQGASIGSYFDGNTASDGTNDYRWTATPGASTSEKYIPGYTPTQVPAQVRFVRVPDAAVRGGDPILSPGGIAVGLDQEAPLGAASSWQAIPVYADGTAGTPSQQVSLNIPYTGVWLKSIDNPATSLQVQPIHPLPTFTRPGRDNLTTIPGTRYPAGRSDVRGAQTWTLSLMTYTIADARALVRLLADGGVVMLQTGPDDLVEPDQYLILGDVDEAPVDGIGGVSGAGRAWTVKCQQVARPATIDAPLYIPGRSYDDTQAMAPTYDQSAAAWPTYQDVWQP